MHDREQRTASPSTTGHPSGASEPRGTFEPRNATRRCSTVLGVAGIMAEGLAMFATVLLWIGLSELRRAFEGADVLTRESHGC